MGHTTDRGELRGSGSLPDGPGDRAQAKPQRASRTCDARPLARYNRAVSAVPTSEHELIRRARAGDEDAFAELVALHAARVFGALRRFGLSEEEADEVAQGGVSARVAGACPV